MVKQTSLRNCLRDTPCVQSLLGFFFNKGVRGGPRIFVNLAAVMLALVLVIKLTPSRLSDSRLSSITLDIWTGRPGETLVGDKEGDDGPPGGLRMVVFGEKDIGTPAAQDKEVGGSKSWTEALCAELGCSRYMTMAPPGGSPAWSVSSKALYASGVENVLNATAGMSGPGTDYSYLSAYYAPQWQTLDLKDQVDLFLAMPKPRYAPNETLWVFNLGFWDVWSLSALPVSAGKAVAEAMTEHIFEQLERLYEASTDPRSIAWSDTSYVPAAPEPEARAGAQGGVRPGKGPAEKEAGSEGAEGGLEAQASGRDTKEHFRILMPRITDPSLLPGWRDLRAQLPKVHSKAEQMRNSAELTDHWNKRIVNGLTEWVRREDSKGGSEGQGGAPDTAQGVPATQTPTTTTTMATAAAAVDPGRSARPRPVREGYAYNTASYVLDAMAERQLRNAGLRDGSGRGGGAVDEGFRDVSNSCVGHAASGRAGANQTRAGETVRVCQVPSDYLFHTPFALSQKAIGAIAVQAADMIRNREAIRGEGG